MGPQWARWFTMHTSFLSYRRKPFVSSCLLKVPPDESLCALPAIIQWWVLNFDLQHWGNPTTCGS